MGRTPFRACGPFLLALLLGACAEDTRPSADESDQLNEAESALDSAPDTLANIDESALVESEPKAENTVMDEGSR